MTKETTEKREMLVSRFSELGMTQESFARAVGVSLLTVNRWVSGRQKPKLTPQRTLLVCTVLNWSLEDLAAACPDDDPETESA